MWTLTSWPDCREDPCKRPCRICRLYRRIFSYTVINNYAIELVNGQQPPYEPIYSLGPIELETLKAYIEANLANGFIRESQSPAGASIFFDQKSDGSLRLYVWRLNNLTIKNRYALPWIEALPFLSKCHFQQEVRFLGYLRSRHVVLTFRYLSDFYQQFIQELSRITTSLTQC